MRFICDIENRLVAVNDRLGNTLQRSWSLALGRRIPTARTEAAENTTLIMHVFDGLTPVAE